MLEIKNLKVNLAEEKKEIIHGVSLNINQGEIHLLNGKNGSGKSTLVNALMGNPSFKVTEGSIKIRDEGFPINILNKIDSEKITKIKNKEKYDLDLNEMNPTERALSGLYLATQYPTEIPGVNLMSFLRLIYNSRKPKEEQLSVFKFKKLAEEKAEIIHYPTHLLKRNLNEGFSGGEKKKTEILQMLILNPKYIFLDEIDSGLDKNSVKEVFEGLKTFKNLSKTSSIVIITHYDRVYDYLKIDKVHEMSDGSLIN